jgi:small multidrug resistance pump
MSFVYLSIAIVCEVVGTSALKASVNFTRVIPTLIVAAGYGLAFYFLSLSLRTIPVGIAYAVWSGAGIVLIAAVAAIVLGEKLDAAAFAGIALIVAGVTVMNVFSRSIPH